MSTPPRPDQEIDPPAQVIAPGGAAGVFKGRLVIVFDTGGGAFSGVFVYSPAPGAGNLIYSVAAAAGTDPYGNFYQPGAVTYAAAGTVPELGNYAQMLGGAFQLNSDRASPVTWILHPAIMDLTDATATSDGPVLNLISPGTLALAASGRAQVSIVGQSQNGAVTPVVISDVMAAWDPNVATHSQAEAWHTLPLAAGWSAIGGEVAPAYRLLPDGNVQITGDASHAAFSTQINLSTAAALPAAYQPATVQYIAPAVGGQAGVLVSTAGTVVAVPSASTTAARFNGVYPVNL